MPKITVMGIAGGTGAGKSTLVQAIKKHFGRQIVCLSHDSYYRDLSHLSLAKRQKVNFDHPDSLETTLLIKQLKDLLEGKTIAVPVYDFKVSNRTTKTIKVEPAPVILVEGILIFANRKLASMFDIKVFVDAEADIRLGRRIKRDIEERGRTLEFSLNQYLTMSKPMHDRFVEPYKKTADIIVPQGGKNRVAINIILKTIQSHLNNFQS